MYFDSRLWAATEGFRLRIAGSVALGIAAAAVAIARLALFGWVLARVLAGEPFADLIAPFTLLAVVIISRSGLQYLKDMAAHRTAARVQTRIRQRLYDQVVALGPAHFGQERTGDVMLSLVDGVEQLETFFGQYLTQLFIAVITPVLIFAFMAFLDLPVATVLLAFALLTLVAPGLFHRWNRRHSMRRRKAYGDFGADFLDAVQGLGTLKAFGQSGAKSRELARRAHELFQSTMWVLASNALSGAITVGGIAIGAATALGVGAVRVSAGDMPLSALLIVLMLGVEVYRPLRELAQLLHQGMMGHSAAEGVFALLDARPLVADRSVADPALERVEPALSFEQVTFTYPGSPQPAHQGLDFTVAPGERVAIVGPSGAGKSSIVRLLLRIYDPQAGRVLVGGRDARDFTLAQLRRLMAVVHQDTYLFHGTVEDNLRMGKPGASHAELEAAARAANIHPFISSLPGGYGTVVGERGLRLSGGQRQRIAIARALLRDAPILILDEALSSVDAENEWLIQEALERLMAGRTTVIFAHRLSSVIGAHRILVLEGGRVAAAGSHAALIARPGIYRDLMAGQVTEDEQPAPGSAGRAPAPPETAPEILPEEGRPLEPTDAILRAEGMGWLQTTVELLRLMAPWKHKLNLTFVLGVGRILSLIGVGVASALVVAAIKAGEPFGGTLALLAVVAPLTAVLHWLESWVSHDMAFRLLAEMRITLFQQLDRLAPAYLLHRRTGDLVGMATQDVETVEYFFAHTVASAFVAILIPVLVLGTLLAFGWPLALVLLPFLVLVGLSPFLRRGRLDALGSRSREVLGDLNAHAVDTVQGLSELVAFQHEARWGAAFLDKVRCHVAVRLPFFAALTRQKVALEAVMGLGGLAIMVTGARLIGLGALPAEYLPLLTLLAMSAFIPAAELAHVGRLLSETLGATRRLYAVYNEAVPVQDGPGAPAAPAKGQPALELAGVTFSYRGAHRPALREVSLSVPAGSTVALVGPSGAGKSTVGHLFMRFWDPQQGAVRMGGHDLRAYGLDHLRRQIALVAQDTYLFNSTLADNILLAKPDASPEELHQAVSLAALEDFVAALPQGLHTPVGERGAQLSGGQRQRVAIARAFLKDAPLLILDEATSHLDAVNEQAVRTALERLQSDRTTLVIAHRLSTVRDADLILVMEDGQIVESGPHQRLLAEGGLYAHLVARQLAGGTVAAAG